jgi:4-oxalocrotonate tautomerase
MPLVQISMLPGRSSEQKRALLAEVTEAVVRTCKVAPEQVRVLISEIAAEHWGVAGVSRAESDARKKEGR